MHMFKVNQPFSFKITHFNSLISHFSITMSRVLASRIPELLLYNLIVRKRLLHLKSEKFNGYACKTQRAWGCHTNL